MTDAPPIFKHQEIIRLFESGVRQRQQLMNQTGATMNYIYAVLKSHGYRFDPDPDPDEDRMELEAHVKSIRKRGFNPCRRLYGC